MLYLEIHNFRLKKEQWNIAEVSIEGNLEQFAEDSLEWVVAGKRNLEKSHFEEKEKPEDILELESCIEELIDSFFDSALFFFGF